MAEQKCLQPGCAGAIEDGFCNTCFMEFAPAGAAGDASVSTGSQRSRNSSALSASAASALGGSRQADSGPSGRSRSRRSGSRSSRSRTHLGCGVVTVPDLPPIDESKIGMDKAEVPADKRFCSKCDTRLIPERDACTTCSTPFAADATGCGKAGCANFGNPNTCPKCQKGLRPHKKLCGHCRRPQNAEKGVCPNTACNKPYDFVPKLKPGEVVAGQYVIRKPLAFGGLGWIFFGEDDTLKRRVVLKGLLDSADEDAAKAAIAEREWLARFDHPNIVKVYTSVTQDRVELVPGEDSRKLKDAYIVMEFIAGRTLKQLRKERGGPLPVEESIAYILPILDALAYLHDQGALYNDLKPENIMLKGDKDGKNPNSILIDLGAVRMVASADGGIYHTPGYSAPEISGGDASTHQLPSVASDVYTAGRTLAALVMNFDIAGKYRHKLPAADSVEGVVLGDNPDLHRWLLKCTRENPDDRFQDCREAAEQLKLILFQTAAARGVSRAVESGYFGGDVLGTRHAAYDGITTMGPALLPDLKMILDDPAAQFILTNGAVTDLAKQEGVFTAAAGQFPRSVEALLRLARVQMQLAKYAEADQALERVLAIDPFEVRVLWYRGLNLLYQNKPRESLAQLNGLWGELPGEPAVKLALAVAAELAGEREDAIRLYDQVSQTDARFVAASFGLARCLSAAGKRKEAVQAYMRVSQDHALYERAQAALARALLRAEPQEPGVQELAAASQTVQALTMQGLDRLDLVAEILTSALALVEKGSVHPDPAVQVLGKALEPAALRIGLYEVFIGKAKLVDDKRAKVALVDQALSVQPRRMVAWW